MGETPSRTHALDHVLVSSLKTVPWTEVLGHLDGPEDGKKRVPPSLPPGRWGNPEPYGNSTASSVPFGKHDE
jgi:hypothetical protein